MRAAVRQAFPGFTQPLEGRIPYMYADTYGYVTTGVGNLIDSIGAAQSLPWQHGDGSPASADEVAAAWQGVKDNPAIYHSQGAGGYAGLNDLRLSADAIDTLVRNKLDSNDATLQQYFPNFESWPADAQLGAHSMAWALGPAFGRTFVHFTNAVNAGDFQTAAGPPGDAGSDTSARGQAWINDSTNPGVRPRNLANKQLFQNAADVVSQGADPDTLYYPGNVTVLSFAQRAVSKWTILGGLALVLACGIALLSVKPKRR